MVSEREIEKKNKKIITQKETEKQQPHFIGEMI